MHYLYFTSEFCAPCKKVKPEIIKHKEIKIIDIDEDQKLSKKYDVLSIPTLLVLNNKNEIEQQITGTTIIKFLKENL